MINKETVLILGAGASIPFNFPSGRQLKNRIITQCIAAPNAQFHDIWVDLNLGITNENIKAFGEALRDCGRQSVDRFLEQREVFLNVGKAAIAFELIKCEIKASLFNTEEKEHWYEYLFNKLETNLDDFANNKLNVITFNYDRSLEFYLTTALANSHGIELDDAHTTLQTMAIIHVHGKLGNLHFGEPYGQARMYEPINDFVILPFCLGESGIKIISEADPGTDEFVSARKLINAAECIIFLGFGYDHINLYRLGILDFTSQPMNNAWVIGSGHGLTDSECSIIEKKLHDNIQIDYQHYQILEFLRNKTPFG